MYLKGILKGVQHLGMPVIDLDSTIKWYEDALGFKEIYRTTIYNKERIDVAFLKSGNLIIEAYQLSGKEYEETKLRSHGHIDHFAIEVKDIKAILEQVISKGVVLDDSTKDGPVLIENFWSKGVKYVNLIGPNNERVELADKVNLDKQLKESTIGGWSHLGIPVTDLEKSKKFYEDLGFTEVMNAEIKKEEGTIKAAFMELGNFQIELYRLFGRDYEEINLRKDGRIDHIALDVADIEKTFQELKEANFDIIDEGTNYLPFWDNGVRYFTIKGPNGEKVEFNQIL